MSVKRSFKAVIFAILKGLQSATFGGLGEPPLCSLTTEIGTFGG
jgi:hypothetical protein